MTAVQRTVFEHITRLGPGWPDLRSSASIGYFLLTWKCLSMIEHNPALLANASFMQYIGMLATGGVLLVGSFLFGGSKTSSPDKKASSSDHAATEVH